MGSTRPLVTRHLSRKPKTGPAGLPYCDSPQPGGSTEPRVQLLCLLSNRLSHFVNLTLCKLPLHRICHESAARGHPFLPSLRVFCYHDPTSSKPTRFALHITGIEHSQASLIPPPFANGSTHHPSLPAPSTVNQLLGAANAYFPAFDISMYHRTSPLLSHASGSSARHHWRLTSHSTILRGHNFHKKIRKTP
jgi:hypothetical protein